MSPSVSKVVCLWEPGIGKIPNGPRQGVLGQILFFTGADSSSSKVDGDVAIYLFDDHGTVKEQARPVQKLVLTKEDLEAVYAETAIGHSYHVPVPYPKDHGLKTVCTMRVKYTSPTGEVTYSDLGSVHLDGAARQPTGLSITRKSAPVSEITPAVGSQVNESDVVRRVGKTEIREASAGANQLESLTIRREAPVGHRTPAREYLGQERSRKRYQLSSEGTTGERSTLNANDLSATDFAPPNSAEHSN